MKFTATIITAILTTDSVLAAHFTKQRWESHAKRAINNKPVHRSGLLNHTQTNDQTSTNWAGSVVKSTGLKSVTGTFTVPNVQLPDDADDSTVYGATAWVGIDGDTGTNSILQTGVDFLAQGGDVEYDAWFEWYPDVSHNFNLEVNAGDVITVTVTATSKSAGKAIVENKSTGKTDTKTFSGESAALSELYAEWIVEDFESDSELIPFADFGSVTFTDASATGSQGTFGPSDGTLMDIAQDGTRLTSSKVSGSELIVKYV